MTGSFQHPAIAARYSHT